MEQSKIEEIKKLRDQQIVLCKKGLRIAKYPTPKRPSTAIRRAFRVLGIAMHCAVIQNQKRTIAAQVPFKEGGIIVEPNMNHDNK